MINLTSLASTSFDNLLGLPSTSGIYFALGESDNVLYVGMAKNLKNRWAAHHRLLDLTKFGCARIAWMCCDTCNLEIFERDALLELRPLLNGVSMKTRIVTEMTKTGRPGKQLGGSNRVSYRVTDSVKQALPLVGGGNATEGIEMFVRAMPILLEAYAALESGSKMQQLIAARMTIALGMERWTKLPCFSHEKRI